ncbi:dihydroneopterin aldolase [Aromatoleum petrolei]|uniref:dihydroneopterin aldolase n=1 Tax=Aromatoleum petrolei TaxID=76116 RepID=A0ABX1MU88_9RHOO|nr:dihydroneopterin aldolase [Aromatoleum petrolei]NMF89639.1 FolB domain-containing protein [Aromatoleum petrolei]QTQ39082.1 Dihydroneopterin aldolase [Aromatoleum petrolei]
MNQIFIDDICADAQVGIYPHELVGSQPVSITLRLGIGGRAARSDRIEDTIDYAELVARLRKYLAERRFALLEHLADSLAGVIFDEFRPSSISLSVHKPRVLEGVGRVGVMIERRYDEYVAQVPIPLQQAA